MAEMKTAKYIVTGVKPNLKLPPHRSPAELVMDGTGGMPTRVMWLDGDRVPGGFYTECVWIWPHCASEDPVWLDGERHVMTRSFLAYIPAGMEHGPLIVRRVERPIFHFTVGPSQQYA